jgi:hypothetical protein
MLQIGTENTSGHSRFGTVKRLEAPGEWIGGNQSLSGPFGSGGAGATSAGV